MISIITTTYNKNDVLRNTLVGLSKQNIPFPYEICIVDDGSQINPEGIIREYIPDSILKFKRLERNIGPINAKSEAYKMASAESNILVTMPIDLILLDSDCIEKICNGVGEKIFTIGEVRTLEIDVNMYKNWDSELKKLKSIFNTLDVYNHVYCGSEKPTRWYIFLGAFRREDAEDINLFGLRDREYRGNLNRGGYKSVFPMVKAMHQTHPSKIYNT